MKKLNILIDLYRFEELSEKSKQNAIQNHFIFLNSLGQEIEEDDGTVSLYEYNPTENEVIDSIEANNYWFFVDGELANTITYTGNHPESGTTVFNYLDKEYII